MIKKKSVKEDKRKNYKPVWEENEGVRQEKLRSMVCNFNTKSQTALLAD